jgi:hypothetical protein
MAGKSKKEAKDIQATLNKKGGIALVALKLSCTPKDLLATKFILRVDMCSF